MARPAVSSVGGGAVQLRPGFPAPLADSVELGGAGGGGGNGRGDAQDGPALGNVLGDIQGEVPADVGEGGDVAELPALTLGPALGGPKVLPTKIPLRRLLGHEGHLVAELAQALHMMLGDAIGIERGEVVRAQLY